ncbi:hypothetical protein E4U42_003371, partial [Claviceps africana]
LRHGRRLGRRAARLHHHGRVGQEASLLGRDARRQVAHLQRAGLGRAAADVQRDGRRVRADRRHGEGTRARGGDGGDGGRGGQGRQEERGGGPAAPVDRHLAAAATTAAVSPGLGAGRGAAGVPVRDERERGPERRGVCVSV